MTTLVAPLAVSGDDVRELAELRRAAARADRAARPTAAPSPPAAAPTPTPPPRPAPPPAPAPRPDRPRVVVDFALAQVGKPYVWAAAGPRAYDCSGLTLAAYRQVGVNLPHYTGAQLERGRAVSRGELRPGDLVFPSYEHVGIYIGGGRMVHAPKPGDRVKVGSVYAFYAGRRLL